MKKLKIVFVFAIILSFIITIFPAESFAYGWVHSYFRSNGTYVRSYVRSSPNAFKFDNYSWRPSQGLYNKSYYAPTKNYSSDWYTPSYITDPDYYFGKSLYESGQRGLGSYTIPKATRPSYTHSYSPGYSGTVGGGTGISIPVIPTTPKITHTCGAHQTRYGTSCYCDDGYKKNYSTGQCEKVVCGAHQTRYGTSCYCDDGYKKNYSTGQCEKVVCGAHQTRYGTSCYCDDGYKKNYSTGQCEKVVCGAHQTRYGTSCYCDDGYKKNYSTGQCEKVIVPANAHLSSWSSQGWYCNTGYKQVGNICQPE